MPKKLTDIDRLIIASTKSQKEEDLLLSTYKSILQLLSNIGLSVRHFFISKTAISFFLFLYRILLKLLVYPVFANIAAIVVETYKLSKKYYQEFFIVFVASLPIFLYIVYLFENEIMTFFFLLLPLLFIISIFVFSLYSYIDKKEKGQDITLIEASELYIRNSYYTAFLLFFHVFMNIELILIFIFCIFSLSAYFTSNGSSWETSMTFWAIIAFTGMLVLIALFIGNIITIQIYYSSVLDKKNFFPAIISGIQTVNYKFFYYVFLYTSLFIFFCLLIYYASLTFYDSGFSLVLLLMIHSFIFLGFVMQRVFNINKTNNQKNNASIFKILINYSVIILYIAGIPSYILFYSLVINVHPSFMSFINTSQQSVIIDHTLLTYENTKYLYSFKYPNSWTIYNRDVNTVQFYNNYSGAYGYGIFVTITVKPKDQSNYDTVYYSKPGIISESEDRSTIVTKVSTLSINNYEAVKYLYEQQNQDNTEYQTHYAIKRSNFVYDLSFTTYDKSVENENSFLFDKMLQSFKFIEKKPNQQ